MGKDTLNVHPNASEHGVPGMQARGLMGQIATSLTRSSPPNQMLFAHPASSGLQTSANPSTVFLLTSSAPEAVSFSQGGVPSPTFLTQLTPQVLFHTLPCSSDTAMICLGDHTYVIPDGQLQFRLQHATSGHFSGRGAQLCSIC